MKLLWDRALGHATLLLGVVLTGCTHQQQVPPLAPQAKTPNIYVPPPQEAQLPPMKESDTPPKLTDAKPAAAEEEVKPKKKTKRQAAPPPVPTPAPANANSEPPAAPGATLGALAPGGGAADPKQQQEVMSKIAAVEKRIGDLPGGRADKEQKHIAKVRQFLKEASDALKGGDVEGAGILATKADLLMDDLTK